MYYSKEYSIGFVGSEGSFGDIVKVASIQLVSGAVLLPNTETVSTLMKENKAKFINDLTFPVNQAKSRRGYPLVLFTYVILNISTPVGVSCCQMTETVGLIDFLLGKIDNTLVTNLGLVVMQKDIANEIRKQVLHKVTCQGENVWQLLQKSFEEKDLRSRTIIFWLQVFSGILLLIFTICLSIGMYFGRKRFKNLHDHNRWTFNGTKFKIESLDGFNLFYICWYQTEPVILSPLKGVENQSPAVWKLKAKRKMHKLINDIQNENLLSLLGVGKRPGTIQHCLVYSRKSVKRSLHFALNSDGHFRIDESIRFHLVLGIMNGLEYLHQKQIVVGQLNSLCTFLDSAWTPKIGNWAEMHQILVLFFKMRC